MASRPLLEVYCRPQIISWLSTSIGIRARLAASCGLLPRRSKLIALWVFSHIVALKTIRPDLLATAKPLWAALASLIAVVESDE